MTNETKWTVVSQIQLVQFRRNSTMFTEILGKVTRVGRFQSGVLRGTGNMSMEITDYPLPFTNHSHNPNWKGYFKKQLLVG